MTAYYKGHISTTTSDILVSVSPSLLMLFDINLPKKLKVGKHYKSITTK